MGLVEETLAHTPALFPKELNMSLIFLAGHRRRDRVPHLRGGAPKPRNRLEGIARDRVAFLPEKAATRFLCPEGHLENSPAF